VLCFIGVKMLADHWYHVPSRVSLFVVAGIIVASIVMSLLAAPKQKK
jgi:tellurite resistance protein TerC